MRQGLGIGFLFQKKLTISPKVIKNLYYLCTMVPFVLFHFKMRSDDSLGDRIIERIDLFKWFSRSLLEGIYLWGKIGYFIFLCLVISFFIFKKISAILPFVFFVLVYAISFLFLNNEFYAYSLLIVSHGVPYFFLMKKRIRLTHSRSFVKKHVTIFLFLLVSFGALLEFHEQDLYDLTNENIYVVALFYTPLIAHFLIDGIIWKKGHEKFDSFKKSLI